MHGDGAVSPSGAPHVFNKEMLQNLGEKPKRQPQNAFPDPTFTRARTDLQDRKMPQAIAHRGYKSKYPENTMLSFRSAVEVGAQALETDVHLSKDNVVVLSHDKTLQRCFGVDKKLLDCEWEYLSKMRTSEEPHEPLPRFEELLEYMAKPEVSDIWLLLDIKVDNDPEDIIKYMSEAVGRVKPCDGRPWKDRLVLGCWAAKFIPLCHDYFPGFPISHIGFSISYSRQFLAVPNVSFNILLAVLLSPAGRKFIKDVKEKKRPLYAWTVNDKCMMRWCIERSVDGVVTDDPKKFLDVCDNYDPEEPPCSISLRMSLNFLRINIMAWVFGLLFWWKYGFVLHKKFLGSS